MKTLEVIVSVASVEVRESYTLLKCTTLSSTEDDITWAKPTEIVKGVKSIPTSYVIEQDYYTKIVGSTPIFPGVLLVLKCEEHIAGVTQYINKDNEVCIHYAEQVESGKRLLGDTILSPTYLYEGDIRVCEADNIKPAVLDKVLEKHEQGLRTHKLSL